jgi:HAD superfamily hydrolase (TIGR01484 family)
MPEYLLASDIDGTLIPAPGTSSGPLEGRQFQGWRDRHPEVALAYISGRHFSSALKAISDHRLPLPGFLGCDVGTSLFRYRGKKWEADDEYAEELRRRCPGWEPGQVTEKLAHMPGLRPQEAFRNREFKVSFYLDGSYAVDAARREVQDRLAEEQLVSVIVSRAAEDGVILVDILPQDVSKRTAVEAIRSRLDLSPSRVVFAGDSGNDVAALAAGYRGILVGNASEEVEQAVRDGAPPGSVYVAERPLLGGVLEGLAEYGLL